MLILIGAALTGCRSSPDEVDASFPTRVDALVLHVPQDEQSVAEGANKPGQWEAELAQLQRRGGQLVWPRDLDAAARVSVDQWLRERLGTPNHPRLLAPEPLGERLGLTAERLQQAAQLYRRHRCLQCHHIVGDGRGPAGQWVTPYPRDFRQGVFKFTTSGTVKPRRQDLLRTLQYGLKGTAMPSFALLAETDRDLLASYVTYLAVRGQVEFEALAALAASAVTADQVQQWMDQRLVQVLEQWQAAEMAPALPAPPDDGPPDSPNYQQAVQRGFALFTAQRDHACINCHQDFGRQPQWRYEVWGTTVRPANLTETPLKSQPSAVELYARIRWGIPAVGMPAHPQYSDRQVWDLVRLVQSLPFPRQLPPPVRQAVYPDAAGDSP